MSKRKQQLHKLIVERGIVASEREGRALIMTGTVLVNDTPVDKPGTLVSVTASIRIKGNKETTYVGRGAMKLKGAFSAFSFNVQDKICADVGSSTGGFTEVLLEEGARRVYAIDTAYGELAYSLREDSRVVCMERTDVRDLATLPEVIDFVSIDVSLVSLQSVLPCVEQWLVSAADVVCLFKPQYEAGTEDLPKGAVIYSSETQQRLLYRFLDFLQSSSLSLHGIVQAPLKGKSGNQEFLCWCKNVPGAHDGRELVDALWK